jgi:DNA-binding MarR family transcriptional regulator
VQASEQVTAGYLVWRLTMKWRAAVERTVAPLGLTHAQYALLASLRGLSRGGTRPSQRELADWTGLEQVYVSKLVRALERSGFVEREPHPGDPRAVQLRLTDRGVAVVKRAVTKVHELQEVLAEPLGGTTGRRYRDLKDMLRTLLGDPRPLGGKTNMTTATTLFGQDLGVAHQAGSRVLLATLDREGVSFHEWVTMKFLNDAGVPIPRPRLAADIATRAAAEPSAIGEVIDRLEAGGVIRAAAAGLELTEDGQKRFDALFATVQDVSGQLLDGLPAEDVEATRRVLAGFTEKANRLLG